MAKTKNIFHCTNCDYRPLKWMGCCPSCKEWESIVELKTNETAKPTADLSFDLVPLCAITTGEQRRMLSGINEWDRVMGGGIMPGSFLILTGDPGIGKSTLLLQIAQQLAQNNRLFYFSSEESLEQIKQRAQRVGCLDSRLLFCEQTNLENIIAITKQEKPDLIIIDSIQNCYSDSSTVIPGSAGQLRESAFHCMRLAKENNIAVILTGHITKEGTIAGPKMLEHMVDGVFYLQGEDRWQTRILRSVKNRFGAIHELGFFEMHEHGLQEVSNINQQLLNEVSYSPGSALISYIEGSRPLLLELQALVVPSKFGIAQRVISGVDQKQVIIIAAILEKYLQIRLSEHDIFFKVSGGFKLKESSIDLGIACALLSSYFQKPMPEKSLILGEIGLTGHIKPINQISIHINEAQKFGLEQLVVAHKQKVEKVQCSLLHYKNVYELLKLF